MKKRNTFKCQIEYLENGKIKVTSYANKQIPMKLFFALNNAVHHVREEYNHEADWKEYFIHFTHDNISYRQIKRQNICKPACEGCVFLTDGNRCQHPHYLDRTKGNCNGKIYIKE